MTILLYHVAAFVSTFHDVNVGVLAKKCKKMEVGSSFGESCINKEKEARRVPTIKQILNCRTKKKEYGQFCSYSFSNALPARYSVLHLTVFCRAVIVEK